MYIIEGVGLLAISDSKMSALAIRDYSQLLNHNDLAFLLQLFMLP